MRDVPLDAVRLVELCRPDLSELDKGEEEFEGRWEKIREAVRELSDGHPY